jgi:hypothetical protein
MMDFSSEKTVGNNVKTLKGAVCPLQLFLKVQTQSDMTLEFISQHTECPDLATQQCSMIQMRFPFQA